MNVLRTDVFQVDTVDLRRYLHVVLHARYGLNVVDAIGYFEQATTVMDAEVLHGLGDSEADGRASARFVGNDQVGGERIEPTIDALDAGIKRLEVDADVGVLLVRHPSPPIKHMFLSNTCSIIPARPDTVKTCLFLAGMVVRLHRVFNAALKSAKQLGKARFVAWA